MKLPIALFCSTLILGGCATRVVDYDPEHAGTASRVEHAEPLPTAPVVVVAKNDNVAVRVVRKDSLDRDGVTLQQWDVFTSNEGREDVCVGVVWRLMDFRYVASVPTPFHVPAQRHVFIGEMVQTTTVINGVVVALPPSGYVQELHVVEPNGSEEPCLFLEHHDAVER